MPEYKFKKLVCEKHQKQITSVCCSNHCQSSITMCQKCYPEHASHHANVMLIQKFYGAITKNVSEQNKRDKQTLQENDLLISSISQYKKVYDGRQKSIINNLVSTFLEQKNQIVKKMQSEALKKAQRTSRYFEKLNRLKLLNMRIKLSSQKGLDALNQSYNIMSNSRQGHTLESSSTFDQSALNGTISEALTNFIKLKISKRDSMKMSTMSMLKSKQNFIVLPPASPRKKRKPAKTSQNLDMVLQKV